MWEEDDKNKSDRIAGEPLSIPFFSFISLWLSLSLSLCLLFYHAHAHTQTYIHSHKQTLILPCIPSLVEHITQLTQLWQYMLISSNSCNTILRSPRKMTDVESSIVIELMKGALRSRVQIA